MAALLKHTGSDKKVVPGAAPARPYVLRILENLKLMPMRRSPEELKALANTRFLEAAAKGSMRKLRRELEKGKGADPFSIDEMGRSALMLSIHDPGEVARHLLAFYPELANLRDKNGKSPVIAAAECGSIALADLCLEQRPFLPQGEKILLVKIAVEKQFPALLPVLVKHNICGTDAAKAALAEIEDARTSNM